MRIGVLAVAMAVLWSLITGQVGVESGLIGLAAGIGLTTVLRPGLRVSARRLPGQLWALVLYMLALLRDILLSGVDVARRVLAPRMTLRLGIIAIPTQDETRNPLILALSANYISLTPGELVVEVDEAHRMYVHCLDVDESDRRGAGQQARRLALLRAMTDVEE